MAAEKEYRNFNTEIRSDRESRTVEGYGVVFNSPSEDLGFTEYIHPEAINEALILKSDVFARFDHDPKKILARSKKGVGSLTLEVDEVGLKYRFEAPKTALGDELLEYLQRGDISGSSFCFSMNPKDQTAEKWTNNDGQLRRDIYHIDRLYDVAPVFSPAYPATTCSNRYAEVRELVDRINAEIDEIINEFNNI